MKNPLITVSIKARLYAIAILILLALSGFALHLNLALKQLESGWHFYQEDSVLRQSLLEDLRTHFGYGGLIHNFKNYVLRGQEKYQQRVIQDFSALQETLNRYRALPAVSQQEKTALDSIESTAAEYFGYLPNIVDMVKAGTTPVERDAVVAVNDGPALKGLALIDKRLESLSKSETIRITEEINSNISFALIAGVLLAIGLSMMIHVISRSIINGIEKVSRGIARVQENNDLGRTLVMRGNDEMRLISDAFNALLGRFSQLLNQVVTAGSQVSNSGKKLTRSVRETNESIQQQHQEIDQVASAMTEMATSFDEVTGNTVELATAAEQTQKEAQEANQLMNTTAKKIGDLRTEVESATSSLGELEEDSRRISSVLEVINEIAEQTNLLALNAAIEAARAGEQGRGFAVVADEVRALATRTRESTEEIRGMIDKLQDQVQGVVKVMDRSQIEARSGAEQAQVASQTLDNILSQVDRVTMMTNQIATASEEQQQITGEMSRNVTNITAVAERTLQNASQMIESTGDIDLQVERLDTEAKQFKC